jgi:hypothetical protein
MSDERNPTTTTAEENRQWVLDRLARNFMRQGFQSDEAWRRAYVLMHDYPGLAEALKEKGHE